MTTDELNVCVIFSGSTLIVHGVSLIDTVRPIDRVLVIV